MFNRVIARGEIPKSSFMSDKGGKNHNPVSAETGQQLKWTDYNEYFRFRLEFVFR